MEPPKRMSISQSLTFNTQSSSFRSALSDWFIILCLVVIGVLLTPILLSPHHQCVPGWTQISDGDTSIYPCGTQDDPQLQYPYKPDTITTQMAIFLQFLPWISTLTINALLLYCSHPALYSHRIALKNIEIMLRMLLFATCCTRVVTNTIKFCVGRPRPNFYALMDRARTTHDHREARMSFPSGHASSAFAVLFLLSLNLYNAMNYAQIRFRQHNKNILRSSINNPHSYFFLQIWWLLRCHLLVSVLLVSLPTWLATYIACTRVTDHWHHYSDVAVGSLIGIAGATVSFMIYRHKLFEPYIAKHFQQKGFDPYAEIENVDGNIEKEYHIQHKQPSHHNTVAEYIVSDTMDETMEDEQTILEDNTVTVTTVDINPFVTVVTPC